MRDAEDLLRMRLEPPRATFSATWLRRFGLDEFATHERRERAVMREPIPRR